jgi:hydrogenase expression/formation protein HypC
MCVAVPGRVLEIADEMAVVEFDGRWQRASLLLVPDAAIGDWVIVAAGTVLEVLDPDEAAEILAMITEAPAQEAG